ncbi:MAG TPA: murein biosynthesis integral membrane protein MurJ [Vicinamibacterales bacterium]|nr:murein biosynthesis integral membrane protein MurJ [Vicinamibacterales bacterium]
MTANALLVAAGIFISKIAGLVRGRVLAHYFGQKDVADAFTAALRIPNLLQNLFGEGALSGSFIPVYAALVARRQDRVASAVAGAVAAILGLVTAVLVLLGVLATPLLISLIAPGFLGDKRDLTITLVQILFPGTGLLVMSAWCLGILNSHHRFLLSYAAPVVWNAAIIATAIAFGGLALPRLAVYVAWGSVVGSALQVAVMVPPVVRLAPGLRLRLDTTSEHVRSVIRNFTSVFLSRGVVQISAYVDQILASYLGTGAAAALLNAGTLYTLPVSLFGMSVSAAELPAMSGEAGIDNERVRARLNAGLRQIAYFVVPSAVAFIALGDVVASALFQTGRFTRDDAVFVWAIVAGSSVGLLASTLGRLYSSTFYALRDTATPLRFAIVRVVLTVTLGLLFAFRLPPLFGIDIRWGTAGLTASAGIAGWIEFLLLRRGITARLGPTRIPAMTLARLWLAALAAAAVGWAAKLLVGTAHPLITAVAVLAPYGAVYIGMTLLLRVPEAHGALGRVWRRRR